MYCLNTICLLAHHCIGFMATVALGSPMFGYMLVAFNNSKSARLSLEPRAYQTWKKNVGSRNFHICYGCCSSCNLSTVWMPATCNHTWMCPSASVVVSCCKAILVMILRTCCIKTIHTYVYIHTYIHIYIFNFTPLFLWHKNYCKIFLLYFSNWYN